MQPSNWMPVFARILLPFLVMAISQLTPIPKQVFLSFQISHLAQNGSRPDKAANSLRSILEKQPWRTALWEEIGHIEQSYGNWEGAAQAYHVALETGTISIQGLFVLGEIYFQLNQYDDALAIWEGLLGSSAKNEELFKKVFAVQGNLARYEDQIDTLQAWVSFQPENPEVYYQLGLLVSPDDIDESIEYFKKAKTVDISYIEKVDSIVGEFLLIEGDQAESYRKLQIGRVLGSNGYWELAYRVFNDAVLLDSEYGEAWAFLSEAEQQLGKDGWEALEKANSLSSHSVVVKALTAIYWRRQNQPEKAIEALEQIVALEPEEGVWLIELGYAVAQLGDIRQAMTFFIRARELSPENPVFISELIRFCVRQNTDIRSVALPAAREFLILGNEDSQSLDLMGLVMMVLEDNISAMRYLSRSVEQDPANASAHLHLGQVYLSQYDMDQAFVHLSLARQLVHNDPQITVAASRLLERFFPDVVQSELE